MTKPHSLPVPPKSWSCVQNDQKWVFIKCKLWLCLTQLESPRKGDFKEPSPPTHPQKNDMLNLLLPHTNQWPRSKNGCLLSMFSTYTNGKLLKRRFRKEFWPAPSTACPVWKWVMGPEWPKMIMSPKMLEISLKADLKHGFWPDFAIQNGPGRLKLSSVWCYYFLFPSIDVVARLCRKSDLESFTSR